jgi:hypothetical protein
MCQVPPFQQVESFDLNKSQCANIVFDCFRYHVAATVPFQASSEGPTLLEKEFPRDLSPKKEFFGKNHIGDVVFYFV